MLAEQDVARLRQQLADTLAGSHRDTLNIKKAITEMQQINQQNLQIIYQKGDQHIAQMDQLEDLSGLIRTKDDEIKDFKGRIQEVEVDNRVAHAELTQMCEDKKAAQREQ